MSFSNPLCHPLSCGPWHYVDAASGVYLPTIPVNPPTLPVNLAAYTWVNPLYSTSATSTPPPYRPLAPHRDVQKPLKSCLKKPQAVAQGNPPTQKETARFPRWVEAYCMVTGKPHQPTTRTGEEWKHYLVYGRRPPPPSEREDDLEPAEETPAQELESTLDPAEEALLDERLELARVNRLILIAGSQPNKRLRQAFKARTAARKAREKGEQSC